MSAPRHFGAVMSAMVTPFDAQGRLDLDAAQRLARWLAADRGNDGLVVAATTGEASTLSDAERCDLVRAVSEAVTVPVLAGTGSNDTAHTVALSRQARGLGAAGVLVVGPYYNRPPQAGIEAHFRAAAAATELPVMLYDVPVRTGRRIGHEVLLRLLREVPNIVAFKDATGDPPAAAALVAEAGDHFDLYCGDDAMTLPLLAVGAVGVVGTSSHWTGPQFARMIAAFNAGEVEVARAINARLLESFAFVNSDESVFSMSVKAMLRALGQEAGDCRLPLLPAPAAVRARARGVWERLNA
ncbi:4-hydroxy-tetrahydrodipicolinate synthase [Caenimonas terrae]|uniref:4-hydroxy-tetrahydrodipicolinate synthase n=1 Tax=Caenimonas terrae TaxID=696074 RepID=A0ABW0NKA2_9BURK